MLRAEILLAMDNLCLAGTSHDDEKPSRLTSRPLFIANLVDKPR
jgi:hypothetical protein